MKKTTLLVFILIPLAIVALFGLKMIVTKSHTESQVATSDARDMKGKMTIAYDGWIGYYPMISDRMKKYMRNEGYLLETVNDNADYPSRIENLRRGKYDFAVFTVDSYVLNAAQEDFPGIIVGVIDESKGGDAMVAYTDVIKDLNSFSDGVTPRVGYTPNSPSDHLRKSVSTHFNAPGLKKLDRKNRFETNGSEEALELLRKKEIDVAILWEPDVSKALEIPGVSKIIGTEDTRRLIVDILVVNRDFAHSNPEQVQLFLKTYFRVLKFYEDDREELKKDIQNELKIKKSLDAILSGVQWVNMIDNCQDWFGVSGPGQTAEQGLVDTIESTVSVLIENGDFDSNPLPDKDPYRIINSSFIQELYDSWINTGFASASVGLAQANGSGNGLDHPFKALTDSQWNQLQPVGSIRVEPIMFKTGSSMLDVEQKRKLDDAVERLEHYPAFRILVGGHTSTSGDAEANKVLSQDRADSVMRYLMITYGVDQNRIKAIGYGGTKPLSRMPGESNRSYGYRLPRVEMTLLMESF